MKTYCEWFAMCTNEATHEEPHPILGNVPCCDRCSQIGRLSPEEELAKIKEVNDPNTNYGAW